MIFIKISNIAQKRVKIKKSTISSFTIRKTSKKILAQYRIGSLEMRSHYQNHLLAAQYRIGSLEKSLHKCVFKPYAQYRIGSLETKKINTVMRIA